MRVVNGPGYSHQLGANESAGKMGALVSLFSLNTPLMERPSLERTKVVKPGMRTRGSKSDRFSPVWRAVIS